MSVTNQQAKELRRHGRPIFGWIDEGDGHFVGPGNFQPDLFPTKWFEEFAERERSSYSPFAYLGTVLSQRLRGRGAHDRRTNGNKDKAD